MNYLKLFHDYHFWQQYYQKWSSFFKFVELNGLFPEIACKEEKDKFNPCADVSQVYN
jgi:hypothetical protein